MVYQLKTREYYGNAQQVLKIVSGLPDDAVEYIGRAMVLSVNTEDVAYGDLWSDGKLWFSTEDDMGELAKGAGNLSVVLVTS